MESHLNKAALLIEDKDTHLVVRTALECAGFLCDTYPGTIPLLRAIKREDHGVIVADLDAPQADCQSLLTWRTNWLNPAVTVIAVGDDDPLAAARALDAGVDDFVAKPVRGAELLARLGAAMRRRRPAAPSAGLTVAGCRLDCATSAIVSSSTRVTLTARELALAQLLFENAGHLVTRERLARDVWGLNTDLISRTIEQHVYQLRRKLKRCAGESLALRGVYGSGYRIDVAEPAARRGAESRPDDARVASTRLNVHLTAAGRSPGAVPA